jgi:hypothetical protein
VKSGVTHRTEPKAFDTDGMLLGEASCMVGASLLIPAISQVIFGVDQFEQMRENGPGGKKIDWDADWIADPIQILSDGSEYHVADPDRPVPENFDQIFEDGDELRMKQLMDWDGTMDLDALRLSNRASGQDRQRKPGDMNNRLNIVDPFGKRSVRRGLRDKASAQKGAIETMQEQQKVDTAMESRTKLKMCACMYVCNGRFSVTQR